MRVFDVDDEHLDEYLLCLEDWSDEVIHEAGARRRRWYESMRSKGLRVKLVEDDDGTLAGMIQYVPVEHSHLEGGTGAYFVLCIWVHGHKQGRGNRQGRGMGKAMLQAAEEDARALGATGLAAWGVAMPFWMKASWFKRHGYQKVDRDGMASLLWKPFQDEAEPPRWLRPQKKPESVPGKVAVDCFNSGWCTALNLTCERAKRAAQEFPDQVVLREHDTLDPTTLREWGIPDAALLDGKNLQKGPPPSYEKIRRKVEKKVKRL